MTVDNHIVYAIKIAGLGATNSDYGGDVDPTDISSDPGPDTLLYRFTSGDCEQDPNRFVVKPYLFNLPDEIGYEIQPWESKTITGTLNVSMFLNPETLPWFTRQNFPISGRLLASIDDSETLLVTDVTDGSLEGFYCYIGRECIYFHTAEVTPGEYTVSREQLYSAAQPHTVSPEYDTGIYDAGRPHNLPGRRITLVRFQSGSGLIEDDEELLWAGTIQGYTIDYADLTVVLECKSFEDTLREGEICTNSWTGALSNQRTVPPGTDTEVDGIYTSLDLNKSIVGVYTADREILNPVDGTTNTVTFYYSLFSDGEYVFTARLPSGLDDLVIAPLASLNDSSPSRYSPVRTELGATIREVYRATNLASTLGDFIYLILTSNEDYGLRLDPGIIIDGFATKVNSILPRSALPEELILGIEGPMVVYELLSDLLKPYLVTLYTNSSGQLDIISYTDFLRIGGKTLDDDDIMQDTSIRYNPNAIPPASSVKLQLGVYSGAKKPQNITIISPQARDRYLETFTSKVELKVLGTLDANFAQSLGVSFAAFRSQTRPTFEVEVLADKNYWPGETVQVSLEDLPNAEGSLGVSVEACTVLSRSYNHQSLTCRYKFLRGSTGISRGSIHLSALVTSFGSGDVYIDSDYYITNNGVSSGWADDLVAWDAAMQTVFTAGGSDFIVDILDEYLTKKGTAKVYQVFLNPGGFIRVSDETTTIVSGDILVPTDYQAAYTPDSILFRYFVYIADNNNTLGSANDPAYRWSL